MKYRSVLSSAACLLTLLATAASAQPKYSADVPPWITTPDSVDTRIGTLRFKNGAPDQKTMQLVNDQIDFGRAIQSFLTGMAATSVYAACEGVGEAGIKRNQGIGSLKS